MMYALPSFLVILGSTAWFLGRRGAAFLSATLLGNWLTNTAIVHVTGIMYPWPLFIAVDYVTALLILSRHPVRWKVVVAVSYGVEMIAHSSYGMSDHGEWAQYRYYWVLMYLAWGQALLCGGWLAQSIIGSRLHSGWGGWGVSNFHTGAHEVVREGDGS